MKTEPMERRYPQANANDVACAYILLYALIYVALQIVWWWW